MDSDDLERGTSKSKDRSAWGVDGMPRAAAARPTGSAPRTSRQTAPEEPSSIASFLRTEHCRRRVTVCSAVSLAVYVCLVVCCLQLPPLPTAFSRSFHEKLSLQLELSPRFFDLTTTACERTAFCQHLVLECAGQARHEGTSADEGAAVDCSDMRCCLALPSLAADVQVMMGAGAERRARNGRAIRGRAISGGRGMW